MSPNPTTFLEHLKAKGYHPRSDSHSNVLAESIAFDLARYCPRIRERAAEGSLVYEVNFSLHVGSTDWNVDLVLGRPGLGDLLPPESGTIRRARPSTVEIAVELKAIMTEHHKAVKNRKRDLEAHHQHVHRYNPSAVAGGVFVINAATSFRSPLKDETTTHKDPEALVRHCLNELRAVTERPDLHSAGLEAKCAIVVALDNVDHPAAAYFSGSGTPALGDPLHYDHFIQTICARFSERF